MQHDQQCTAPPPPRYSENDRAPFSTGPSSNAIAVPGGKGDVTGCSVWFNGTFYDNVSIRCGEDVQAAHWSTGKQFEVRYS